MNTPQGQAWVLVLCSSVRPWDVLLMGGAALIPTQPQKASREYLQIKGYSSLSPNMNTETSALQEEREDGISDKKLAVCLLRGTWFEQPHLQSP